MSCPPRVIGPTGPGSQPPVAPPLPPREAFQLVQQRVVRHRVARKLTEAAGNRGYN